MKNVNSIMKQAQKMQAKMAQIQEELKDATVEASVGGGTVKAVVTGDIQLRSVEIDPAAVDPDDVELLQDMVTAAVNEGIRGAQELAARKMQEATGGLDIPGLM